MKIVADLHIHSHYSRATSKNLTPQHLARWAQLKGINVIGTGDIAHPGWLQELAAALEPAEEGLFRLKPELAAAVEAQVPPACRGPVRFLLGGEISNIYKRDEKTRKVHNLVFAPGFDAVERLQARLDRIGNIRADGRPILGLDARNLLEIVLETAAGCCLIPAHIWTPWFSLLGSKSGFDSVEACFGDLTPHVFALETGLSSDPPMNWRISALDRYTLVSNSDAHSPEKLGREATLFDSELAYPALFDALRTAESPAYGGTIEFFPEEGKYHFDGHRACGIAWDPPTTLAHGCICPVCGKEVTVGVMHRVEALADRPPGSRPERAAPYASMIPLPEVLGEVYDVGAGSRQVEAEYMKLLGRLGPELAILRDVPVEEIRLVGGERLAEAIRRMRHREVTAEAGYDGEYGVIRVFPAASARVSAAQIGLFGENEEQPAKNAGQAVKSAASAAQGETPAPPVGQFAKLPGASLPEGETPGQPVEQVARLTDAEEPNAAPLQRSLLDEFDVGSGLESPGGDGQPGNLPYIELTGLNDEQRAAALCTDAPLIIAAGPGTGKTRTLTVRIAYLILHQDVPPEAVLAITFTNKAAGEMAERLAALLGPAVAGRVTIKTFHAFGAGLLRQYAGHLGLAPDFALCAAEDRPALLRQARPDLGQAQIAAFLDAIGRAKDRLLGPDAPELQADEAVLPGLRPVYLAYEAGLAESSLLDFDDLILRGVQLLQSRPDVLAEVRTRYRWISVDEYQDVNYAQYCLLRLLASTDVNLCVIGDPDQAIYGFRGADRGYFMSFEADYPGARSLRLNTNYRSTQLILDAAVQVIGRQNSSTPPRPLSRLVSLSNQSKGLHSSTRLLQAAQALSAFAEQVKLDVYDAPTDRAEAEYVVHQIEQMVGGTSYFSLDSGRVAGSEQAQVRSFADFAVLYRLGAQSRLLVEAFARSGIPYQTAGQIPLHAQPLVRQVLACLWLLRQPASRLHLETMLAAGKAGLGPKAILQVWEHVSAGVPLAEAMARAARESRLGARQSERLREIWAFWRAFGEEARSMPVVDLMQRAAAFITGGEPLVSSEADHLGQLRLRAVPYGDRLADFLDGTALQGETDVYDPRADRVALMTLHAAKGLEFPVVFVVGCEEGLLPYVRPGEPADLDEERRLFYVGMTRARQKLVLTRAHTRFLFGQRVENAPSRFVGDIESALKEVQEMQRRGGNKPENKQLSLF